MYVLDREVRGRYSVQSAEARRAPQPRTDGASEAANDEIPQQLTDALAAGEDSREVSG